ncbi:MAG TPA: hypothetical protein VLI54_04710 [Bacillota bacterium]|nr:hypothetical protein [Bacillota bacterium]
MKRTLGTVVLFVLLILTVTAIVRLGNPGTTSTLPLSGPTVTNVIE